MLGKSEEHHRKLLNYQPLNFGVMRMKLSAPIDPLKLALPAKGGLEGGVTLLAPSSEVITAYEGLLLPVVAVSTTIRPFFALPHRVWGKS